MRSHAGSALGFRWSAIIRCLLFASTLPLIAPIITHAQTNPEAADQACAPGNYECDYGEQPPKGEKGPCMLNKPCQAKGQNENVRGICESPKTCRTTSVNGQAPETPTAEQRQEGGPLPSLPADQLAPETSGLIDENNDWTQVTEPGGITGQTQAPQLDWTQTTEPGGVTGQGANIPDLPYSNTPIFNETTGQWEGPNAPTPYEPPDANLGTDQNIFPSNTAALAGPDDVFSETTGQWESQPLPSGCSFLFDTCKSSVEPPMYPTPELPRNPLAPPPQQPGTVLQYNESEGAQNFQYAYPTQPTFSSDGLQTASPLAPTETAASLSIFQQLLNWYGSLLR
jgi:hypothetical protein